jgi:hypothetical protein
MATITLRKCHTCKLVDMAKYERVCATCKSALSPKRIRDTAEQKAFNANYYLVNRDEVRAIQRAWRESVAGQRQRFGKILRKYGITAFDWAMYWKRQDGKCAGCLCVLDFGQNTCVDHCHKTGTVRGLLCGPCNRAIGALNDCEETLGRLICHLRNNTEAGGISG